LFLHHISRDGDPHLHVHVAIWNRVQRTDQADEKWRTLDSRSLHNQRLAVAPVTDRIVETRLSALDYAMVPRLDGNAAWPWADLLTLLNVSGQASTASAGGTGAPAVGIRYSDLTGSPVSRSSSPI
jgi:hypothetical protein